MKSLRETSFAVFRRNLSTFSDQRLHGAATKFEWKITTTSDLTLVSPPSWS